MSARARWIGGFLLVLVLSLGSLSIASAQDPKPIITTPTPAPAPTIPPQFWPEIGRRGRVVFMPIILGGNEQAQDVVLESFQYQVQPGDTLWALALDFGRDLDTMSCTTDPLSADAETLIPGQTVTVPALSDMCYTATPGDTLDGIAARFGVSVDTIVAIPWNGFSAPPYAVRPRQRILLPGVRRSPALRPDRHTVSSANDSWAGSPWPEWPYGDGQFVWPVNGRISQGFHPGHYAIDIAVPSGTPILAADRGTVIMAGWNPTGYGFRVVIDHGNDYLTLYAHLSDIYVEKGQVVGKSQRIGVSGANGNITGPHLHFEIRDFGYLTDPLRLLPD